MSLETFEPIIGDPSPDNGDWMAELDPSLADLFDVGAEIAAEHAIGGLQEVDPSGEMVDQQVIADVMHLDDEGEFSSEIETPTAEYLGNLVFRSLTEAEEELVARADEADITAGGLVREGKLEEATDVFKQLHAWTAERAFVAEQQAKAAKVIRLNNSFVDDDESEEDAPTDTAKVIPLKRTHNRPKDTSSDQAAKAA